jgi:5-methylcytosine-specific restriction enzyme subunit McrC
LYSYVKETKYSVAREDIFWSHSESEDTFTLLPKMQTDISLSNDIRKIIIDTKYYKDAFQYNYDTEKIRSNNIYQMYAYLKQVEKKGGINNQTEGILLYPSVENTFSHSTSLDGHKFSVKSINLNQDWKEIHNDLLNIIN